MPVKPRQAKFRVFYARQQDLESGIAPRLDAHFDSEQEARLYVDTWNLLYNEDRLWYECTTPDKP